MNKMRILGISMLLLIALLLYPLQYLFDIYYGSSTMILNIFCGFSGIAASASTSDARI